MNFWKYRKRALSLLLALGLFLLPQARAVATADPVPLVRLGLYWGDEAMEAANLLNETGSGYSFGYYDEGRSFVTLGYTGESAITMLKDWSMYLYNGKYTSDAPASGAEYKVLGCYHIRLGPYDSFQAASEAASAYDDGFPAWLEGAYYACVGNYTSFGSAESAMNQRGLSGVPATGSDRCVTVAVTGSTQVLFQFDGGTSHSLGVLPQADEGVEAKTWFRNRLYYGGFQYTRLEGGNLTVVNFLDIDAYVRGVVPYEMNPEWPLEALKAQAITARTYAAAHLDAHKRYGFDLCGTVCCQTYLGAKGATANSDRAVLETSGVYITYEGKYADTFYHSCDGGATEDSENVFFEEIPYLRGVIDPYESRVETGYEAWSFVYTATEITAILRAKGYNCGAIVSVTPTYTALGNIYSLKFTDDNGKNWTFSKEKAGSILYSSTYQKSTYSQRFTVAAADGRSSELYVNGASGRVDEPTGLYVVDGAGQVQSLGAVGEVSVLSAGGAERVAISGSGATITADSYRFSGSGWGHNIGMSQFGAKAMAELGFACEDILRFYFNGVSIG